MGELACGGSTVVYSTGRMSSRKVVWFRYVFSMTAFPFVAAAHIALVVYGLLFAILSIFSMFPGGFNDKGDKLVYVIVWEEHIIIIKSY